MLLVVDGKFLGHGPARAGHGHFRIDEWPLKDFAGQGTRVMGFPAGTHGIETSEPYTLRHLHAKVRNSPDDWEFNSPATPDSEK